MQCFLDKVITLWYNYQFCLLYYLKSSLIAVVDYLVIDYSPTLLNSVHWQRPSTEGANVCESQSTVTDWDAIPEGSETSFLLRVAAFALLYAAHHGISEESLWFFLPFLSLLPFLLVYQDHCNVTEWVMPTSVKPDWHVCAIILLAPCALSQILAQRW